VDGGSATVNVLPATADIPYAWWGRSFEWAPSGDLLAYAQANEVGTVSLAEQTAVPIASFPEYRTRSSWAWVPELSWAADGSLLAFVAHEPDGQGVSEPDSASFAL
jgi:hypothetical protein